MGERTPTPAPEPPSMPVPAPLAQLDQQLDTVPGVVSVWCAPLAAADHAYYRRCPDAVHYAASTMKLAVLLAVYRGVDRGELALTEPVRVHADFASSAAAATDAPARFTATAEYDSDAQVWQHLGDTVELGWLVHRMIVVSANLATNLVIERIGFAPVAQAWQAVDARGCRVERLIEDAPATAAGRTNTVTAHGLARVLAGIGTASAATVGSCAAMLELLHAQRWRDDVVLGLPAGTRVAHKNGWVDGVRHSAALIEPADTPPYLLVTCISSPRSGRAAARLVADVAAATWPVRAVITGVDTRAPAGR